MANSVDLVSLRTACVKLSGVYSPAVCRRPLACSLDMFLPYVFKHLGSPARASSSAHFGHLPVLWALSSML